MDLFADRPLCERWSDTLLDEVAAQQQRLDTQYFWCTRGAAARRVPHAPTSAKMRGVAPQPDHVDEGVDADLGGRTPANNNCATFAREFFAMVVDESG